MLWDGPEGLTNRRSDPEEHRMVYVICILLVLGVLVNTRQARAEGLSKLKEMYLETELVSNGEAKCLIAVPDGADYGRLGQRLSEGIGKACGAAPPLIPVLPRARRSRSDRNRRPRARAARPRDPLPRRRRSGVGTTARR